jgi:hypothetical protein
MVPAMVGLTLWRAVTAADHQQQQQQEVWQLPEDEAQGWVVQPEVKP